MNLEMSPEKLRAALSLARKQLGEVRERAKRLEDELSAWHSGVILAPKLSKTAVQKTHHSASGESDASDVESSNEVHTSKELSSKRDIRRNWLSVGTISQCWNRRLTHCKPQKYLRTR